MVTTFTPATTPLRQLKNIILQKIFVTHHPKYYAALAQITSYREGQGMASIELLFLNYSTLSTNPQNQFTISVMGKIRNYAAVATTANLVF